MQTFAGVASVLCALALVTVYLLARRATRIDRLHASRVERCGSSCRLEDNNHVSLQEAIGDLYDGVA
jgi:hypothetical protein